jgi:lipopolysaccharide exporter
MTDRHESGKTRAPDIPNTLPVGQLVAAGAFWTLGFKFVERLLGLVSTIILARLLSPEHFGLVAMAMTFVTMIELFTTLGFEQALIRDQQATRAEYDTAWTLNIALGLAAGLSILALAQVSAVFFQEPRLPPYLYLLATVPLLDGLQNTGVVDFRKHLQFAKDFNIQVVKKLVAVIVTVVLALMWRNAWALVIGIVAGRAVGLIMSYVMHPFRPRLSLSGGRGLLRYSLWIFINNLLNFLRTQGANFVVGRIAGGRPLGLYNAAYELSNLPTSQLVMPLNRAVMPGFAKLAHDPSRIQRGFLKVLAVVAIAAIPAGVGMSCLAHLVVPLVLGQQWLDAIPAMRWLAIFGITLALQMNVQSLYNAIGRPHVTAYVTAGLVTILLPTLVFMVQRNGIVGAAQAYVVTGLLVLPANYALAVRVIQMRAVDVLRELWRPFVASLVMVAALRWFPPAAVDPGGGVLLWRFATSAAFGAGVYAAVVWLTWRVSGSPEGGESFVLERWAALKTRWQRR